MTNDETIKCGKAVFDLVDGDTVMDNGFGYQLVSRKTGAGWIRYCPVVSNAAFQKFKDNPRVSVNKNHDYGSSVILYRYTI